MNTIELRALLVGAAPRPWQWLDSGAEVEGDELQGGDGEMIASGFRDDLASILPDGEEALTDGRLCAAAVNALPELLDERDALLAVAEVARRFRDDLVRQQLRWVSDEYDPLNAALARLDGAL